MEDGGFEIEVYLRERPASNTFRFAIEGAEELDFFYQPELTPEEIEEGAVRPENVVGSSTVYHKTQANHRVTDQLHEPSSGSMRRWRSFFAFFAGRATAAHHPRAQKRTVMHKLLLAIDGSESASRALEYALKLAKENGPIELHLLTVHPEPVIYGEIQVYVPRERMEELQRKHSEDILRPALERAKTANISHTSEILIGEIAPMIVKRAEELNCDCIVMGTRGMGAIGNLVLGSVAIKVVHLTKLPVTLVK